MEQTLETYWLPSWQDIPDLDLYLDQVLSFVTQAFAPYEVDPSTKILTGSMINNYVKHKVMPAPKQKRYQRKHVAYLFMILVSKATLSLDATRSLLARIYQNFEARLTGKEDEQIMEAFYTAFREALHRTVVLVHEPERFPETLNIPEVDDFDPAMQALFWVCLSKCSHIKAIRRVEALQSDATLIS